MLSCSAAGGALAGDEGGLQVDLQPGEVLFVPKHWWHHVTTLSRSALSVNTWLDDAGDDAVDAKFDKAPYGPECSMEVRVRGAHFVHVLAAERLCGVIVPGECKHKVTKKGKLVVTMKKAHKQEPWEQLRSKVQLPFRRGGGGNPR